MKTTAGAAVAWWLLAAWLLSCTRDVPQEGAAAERTASPAILLVTLDTTRADVLGFDGATAAKAETPNLDALARRGVVFAQAYTTAPLTLPSHASMLTGLYPGEHHLHENGRVLDAGRPLLSERLSENGYHTAAFISGFPLERQFGLARGFDLYDDHFGDDGEGGVERSAAASTDRAIAWLLSLAGEPVFAWVHYYDAHEPYAPPEPFRSRYLEAPYLGEIAYVDQELGRLLEAFETTQRERPTCVLVVGDHGEGLGDHGEALHGNLLYQGVARVPLLIAGDGIDPGQRLEAASVRRVFATIVGWAGTDSPEKTCSSEDPESLLAPRSEVVLGEAMKPYLQYGWQPQVMAVRDGLKAIRSGGLEIYDLRDDPAESTDLSAQRDLPPEMRRALRDYPLPQPGGSADDTASAFQLSATTRERLAALGYADFGRAGGTGPRSDAPSAREMTHLFADLDLGSGLFVRGEYRRAIPVLERLLLADPGNLMVVLRLAVARSVLGDRGGALDLFARARRLDPASADVRHYLGLHHLRFGEWEQAEALLESVLQQTPNRLPALEGLAGIRERQGRPQQALELWTRVAALDSDPYEALIRVGELSMASLDTAAAIDSFERALALRPGSFSHFLELGVCYLSDRRLEPARDALDQVPESHPGHALALFKRAQVSVLLAEPDRLARYRNAVDRADATTRPLIENEPLFRELRSP